MNINKMKIKLTILGILLIAMITLSTKSVEAPECVDMYYVEEAIEVEEWMTEPFCEEIEEPLELEEWMTKPFNI